MACVRLWWADVCGRQTCHLPPSSFCHLPKQRLYRLLPLPIVERCALPGSERLLNSGFSPQLDIFQARALKRTRTPSARRFVVTFTYHHASSLPLALVARDSVFAQRGDNSRRVATVS